MREAPSSAVSSGNPYAGLGMPDAGTRLAKAKLALSITAFMSERNLTQDALARRPGIDLPEISTIACGHLGDFSLERLTALVNCLDMVIEIRAIPNLKPTHRQARVVVRDVEESLMASSR
jgi:predicted XRE-type DNA-binding protein